MNEEMSYYTATAFCGDNIIARIWRKLDDIYFNVFRKHRNPLTPIIISDLLTEEEEEALKESLRKSINKIMERYS